MIAHFHVPIAGGERETAVELQSMLVDLLDLALIGKQAHWNVEGRHFRSLHGELDELGDSWHALADVVAERADDADRRARPGQRACAHRRRRHAGEAAVMR